MRLYRLVRACEDLPALKSLLPDEYAQIQEGCQALKNKSEIIHNQPNVIKWIFD